MKVVLIEKREYDFTTKDTGERITGNYYTAWDKQGKMIKFSSREDHKVTPATSYTPELAQDVNLQAREFKGTLKWREE